MRNLWWWIATYVSAIVSAYMMMCLFYGISTKDCFMVVQGIIGTLLMLSVTMLMYAQTTPRIKIVETECMVDDPMMRYIEFIFDKKRD